MKTMNDEELIAALLYYHLEDFAEAVASKSFTKVVKAAFLRLGLRYEPFGPDALEAVEKRRNEVHMIKLPVKDPNTIPWMTPREIPAIKAVLSEWRKMRHDNEKLAVIRETVAIERHPNVEADIVTRSCAFGLEMIAAIDERLRKEAKK